MPKYHFHSADGERVSDREGTDLADEAEAQIEAVKLAGEMLAQNPKDLWELGHWRIEVTNDDNVLLFTVMTIAIDAPRPGKLASSDAGE